MVVTTRQFIPYGDESDYIIVPLNEKTMDWQRSCKDEEAFVIVADNLGTGCGEACIAIGSPDVLNNPYDAAKQGNAIGIILSENELLDLIESLQMIYDSFGK